MLKRLRPRNESLIEPNEYRVLRLVRDSNPISRTEISQLCNLSKPTVSEIVNRFLKGGFLESVGESASTDRGGRKRELLKFNPSAGFVIGVDVRMTECRVAITDLNADILRKETFAYAAGATPDSVLTQVFRSINSFLGAKEFSIEKCVGIGIGLPGLIDRSTGVIKVADTLTGWEGVNLHATFEERFRLPVYVENDVKARTLAEFLFGAGKHVWDQVFLWIGDGIGAGIIIDGKLHHGITESAGEVGYNELGSTVATPEKFPLMYRSQRDFGDILSDSVMIDVYHRAKGGTNAISIDSIFHEAKSGDQTANQLIEEVASLASIVCINLINTLNPALIVIGGKIADAGDSVLGRIQTKVKEDILSVPAKAVRILPASLKQDGVILGAVGLVLYDLFKPTPASVEILRTHVKAKG